MEPRRPGLAAAQWIVTLMYVVPLVVFPLLPRFVHPDVRLGAGALQMVSYALLLVGLVDYGVSLFMERLLLSRAAPSPDSPRADAGATGGPSGSSAVVAAALVVGAFGASLAIYGLVLTLLGARAWGAALYVLCAAHGFHLLTRWPAYVRAAEGAR